MQLFDCDDISITKIYSVEKYNRITPNFEVIKYGTLFYSYQFIFFLSGENATTVGTTDILDCPNSIRYIPKGHLEGKYIVKRLTKSSACIDIYFDTDSPMPPQPIGLYNNEIIKDRVLKLFNTWKKKEVGFYADSMKIFYDIIAALQKERYNYLSVNQKQYMQKAYNYITKHYRDNGFDYKVLCAATGLEYAYFSELFKKTFKMSPVRFVTKMRIDYAKELLVTNRRSVSEIAEMCGFSNTYYFSNVFKKQTGFSPSQYPIDDI